MSPKLDKEILYSMSNNPINWKGLFYVNRKDPRIIVPKRLPSLGWTLNFGHPISYVFISVFVLAVIGLTIFTK
jgi:uncharacterized membrane protein